VCFDVRRYSHNGERLGTYEGHKGSIWSVAVDCTSVHSTSRLISARNRSLNVQHCPPSLPRPHLLVACVWSCVTAKSELLLSGAADNTMKLWQVATGKLLYTWEFPTAVKRVAWKLVLSSLSLAS
jgi:translation initiation factor 3 subunit I